MTQVGDIETMADLATDLLLNEEKLIDFKTNARKHALQFDIANIVPEYEALYNRFVDR
jgi:hypothetical protein